ncbi:Cell division control protein 3 [Psilocybe cubensis]|uniref:Cell division control protein 3 n=1 Tax=Psilocybe cubensis TaxID=181762 RepID=A0ACB8HGR4_PSICU|nr:Cell division control protein 3 [Psilocybe cubensis]KAH9487029.1 Cell division control protein 3 [Psilocybe cubensis]
MPKISSSARSSRAYDEVFHRPLQQSQIDAIYAFRSRFVCDGVIDKDISEEVRNVLWLTEAILRTNGLSSMERPKVNLMETRGRTIYDAQPIDFGTPTPTPQAKHVLVRRLSEVLGGLEELDPETVIFPIKNIAEPITPPRKTRQDARARYCASTPNASRSPTSDTLFLTLRKKSQKRFFTSPGSAEVPDSPGERRGWSRSPTPPLSWSVESSPESVETMGWEEDWEEIEALKAEDSFQKLFEIEPRGRHTERRIKLRTRQDGGQDEAATADFGLLLPKPKLDVGFATSTKQRQHRPTSFLPLVQVNLKMADSYTSSRNGDIISNGGLNGSSPSLVPTAHTPAPSNVIRKKLMGYVGFANLPNQVHRKSVRKGFQFTAMVVGESGLGKSTLINTLFNTTLYPPKEPISPAADRPKTVAIESIGADIEENGVRLHLTVVDTPGFGDFVNNDDSWKPIVENIESRFDSYLEQENRVNRTKIVDNRVHACLYFIQPTGHSLKQLDIEFMRRLHTKVNLIPIIAKADTLTDEEVTEFKERILADIAHHNIHIFQAPTYENEDEETIAEAEEIAGKIPFAVVGSDRLVNTPDGRQVRGRAYPWGVVEVDNEEHCDFVKLRQMLVRTYMEELREYTNDVLYENWRTEKLLSMGVAQDSSVFKEINPAARLQEERVLHEAKLAKMEAEMKMVFLQKVQEKEAKLKQSEEELYARHKEMKDALEKQRADLEDKKRKIESGRPLTPEKSSTTRKKGFLRT